MAGLLPNFVWQMIDRGLIAVGKRMDQARERSRRAAFCATIAPTATLYAGTEIANFLKDPKAVIIGSQTSIRGQLLIFWNAGRIEIGHSCYVGSGSRIWSQADVTIGNHVLISHLVDIHDTDGHPTDPGERRLDAEAILTQKEYLLPTKTESRPIRIEDDVWIGFKASILKGVCIGRGSIVAAGSVVTKSVPPYTVVAGNPARPVKQLMQPCHRS